MLWGQGKVLFLYPGGRGNTCFLLQTPGASPPTQLCSAAPQSALVQPPAMKVSFDRRGGGSRERNCFTPKATQISHVPIQGSTCQAALPSSSPLCSSTTGFYRAEYSS